MYQNKVVHPLSRTALETPHGIDEHLWALFVAIGDYWKLGDDPDAYRSRLRVFMDNRMAISPLYSGYYGSADDVISDLIATHGSDKAFEILFKTKIPDGGVPGTAIEVAKRFVVNEFITMRLGFGGFKSFGARNFNGYFGGTNDPADQPYRGIGEVA